jgi:hypothetical protein
MMRYLVFLEFWPPRKDIYIFLFKNLFLTQTLRKEPKYLDRLINDIKKSHKNPKSTQNKKLSKLRFNFLGNFKVKKAK